MHWRKHKARDGAKPKRPLSELLTRKTKDTKKGTDISLVAEDKNNTRTRISAWFASKTAKSPSSASLTLRSQEVADSQQPAKEDIRNSQINTSATEDNKTNDVEATPRHSNCRISAAEPPVVLSVAQVPFDDNASANSQKVPAPKVERSTQSGDRLSQYIDETVAFTGAASNGVDIKKTLSSQINRNSPEEIFPPKGPIQDKKESRPRCKCGEPLIQRPSPYHNWGSDRCWHCGRCEYCISLIQGNRCTTCQDKRPIMDLPIELLELICSFLGTPEKLIFRLSCKALYRTLPAPRTRIGPPDIDHFFHLIRGLIPSHLDYCQECMRYHRPESKTRIVWPSTPRPSMNRFCLLAYDRPDSRSVLRKTLKSGSFLCRYCFHVRGGIGCRSCQKCSNCSGVWYSRSVVECIECDQGKVHCMECRRLKSQCRGWCVGGSRQCRMCRLFSPKQVTCSRCGNCGQCAVLLPRNGSESVSCTSCTEITRGVPRWAGSVRDVNISFGSDVTISSDYDPTIFRPYSFQFNSST